MVQQVLCLSTVCEPPIIDLVCFFRPRNTTRSTLLEKRIYLFKKLQASILLFGQNLYSDITYGFRTITEEFAKQGGAAMSYRTFYQSAMSLYRKLGWEFPSVVVPNERQIKITLRHHAKQRMFFIASQGIYRSSSKTMIRGRAFFGTYLSGERASRFLAPFPVPKPTSIVLVLKNLIYH